MFSLRTADAIIAHVGPPDGCGNHEVFSDNPIYATLMRPSRGAHSVTEAETRGIPVHIATCGPREGQAYMLIPTQTVVILAKLIERATASPKSVANAANLE